MTCVCGKTFKPPRGHGNRKKFCSPRCRSREAMRQWRASSDKAAAAQARSIARQREIRAANPERFQAYEAARYAADPEHYRARRRAYHAENREKENAAQAAWRAANPGKSSASSRKWEAAHPEKKKAMAAANYAKHREARRLAARIHRAAHQEKYALYNREYIKTHRALRTTIENARRARKAGNGGSHTVQDWLEKLELFAYCCAYCGEAKPLTVDHQVPLSRGGTDDIMNIVPACRNCNSHKRHRTAQEFIALRVAYVADAKISAVGTSTARRKRTTRGYVGMAVIA